MPCLAQARMARPREYSRKASVHCSRPRPGEGFLFWVNDDLAQVSWSRPSEGLQSATVTDLAQARMPSISEAVAVA